MRDYFSSLYDKNYFIEINRIIILFKLETEMRFFIDSDI